MLNAGGVVVARYDAPRMHIWMGAAIALVTAIGLARNAFVGDAAPNGFAVAATLVSILVLLFVGRNRDPVTSAMRTGFHGGMFGFFLAMPVLGSTTAEQLLSERTVETVGWSLVLTVLGFEAGYWSRALRQRSEHADSTLPRIPPRVVRLLKWFMLLGVASWAVVMLDSAVAGGVSFWDVALTMRGDVAGADYSRAPTINPYLGGLLASATYLAAASASVLLTVHNPQNRLLRYSCWAILLVCAFIGWLRGSRAMFLYAFAPILTTLWPRFSSNILSRGARVLVVAICLGLVALAWGGQSALRGGDIRRYEQETIDISPAAYAHGAFDIFAELGPIVEAFPSLFPYQYGKSLIPLVLGWLPRPLWESKPYPFSLYANLIRGESLEHRSASLAVGLTGEGYGQGGLLGVLLYAALMGFLCRFGDERLGRFARHHPLRLQLAAICAIWAAMIVRGSPPEMFYMGLFVWLFVYLLARYVSKHCMVQPTRS